MNNAVHCEHKNVKNVFSAFERFPTPELYTDDFLQTSRRQYRIYPLDERPETRLFELAAKRRPACPWIFPSLLINIRLPQQVVTARDDCCQSITTITFDHRFLRRHFCPLLYVKRFFPLHYYYSIIRPQFYKGISDIL